VPTTPSRLILFGGAVFAVESGFSAVLPPLIPHLVHEFGLSTSALGVLVAAYPAGVLVGAVPSVALVDRSGVRTTTFAGLGLLVFATIGFAAGNNALLLTLTRFVQGLGGTVAWVGALAWLMASTARLRRGGVIGASVAVALMGTVVGPTIGALAAETGRGPVFGGLAVVLAAIALGAPAAAPSPTRVGGSVRAVLKLLYNRHAGIANGTLFVIGIAGGSWSLIPLLVDRRGGSATTIAWMLAIGYLLAAGMNLVVGLISDRIGRRIPIVCLLLVAAALLPWPPLAGSLGPLIVTSIGATTVLAGLATPTAAMVADAAGSGASAQAIAVAAMNAAWAAGGAIGPALMADAAAGVGFVMPFVAAACLCVATAMLAVALHATI
jgi:MFS family permease